MNGTGRLKHAEPVLPWLRFNARLRLIPGHHDEALAVAERGRTRAFADLLVERQTGQQDSDPYTPVTVEHILDTVNGQRALVLYYSVAAGYLYSWLLAPGSGKRTHRSRTDLWIIRPECGETLWCGVHSSSLPKQSSV